VIDMSDYGKIANAFNVHLAKISWPIPSVLWALFFVLSSWFVFFFNDTVKDTYKLRPANKYQVQSTKFL
jgi:hypothetical protein